MALVFGGATASLAAVPSPQQTVPGSVTATGAVPLFGSERGAVSDDGRFVVFVSSAPNLPSANGSRQVYLHDLQNETVELLTPNALGTSASSGNASRAVISADGNWVAFISAATDLVTGFNSGMVDQAYIRDLANDATKPLSINPMAPLVGGTQGVTTSSISLSVDGARAAFVSSSTLSAVMVPMGIEQAYVTSTGAVAPMVASLTTMSAASAGETTEVALSHDGTKVAFICGCADLDPALPAPGGDNQAFARDVTNLASPGTVRMVSENAAGTLGGNGEAVHVAAANDGAVAFSSEATDLVSPAIMSTPQVYLSPASGALQIVSHKLGDPAAAQDDSGAGDADDQISISADGQRVSYSSRSTQLTPLGGNAMVSQVYLWQRTGSLNTVVSVTPAGDLGNSASFRTYLSANGTFIVFLSGATDLVPGFAPDERQQFLRNLAAIPPAPTPTSTPTNDAAAQPGLARTGAGAGGVLAGLALGGAILALVGAGSVALYRRRSLSSR